ncbi:MFS general substrate transporter [Fomitiporia mediterranea MF3/22]|uniref:MFS general substrate transporter n=1 Tax=Fomitiporia mediterranea (strain MF3/22) TaxID=694068 RepID=UPI0004408113|nr:MFS general substrate transporter [Fomitiporia mediterranea MF3/22]EJD03623.1 MFS general substrate transporter [Fomitiporia mediterranea MF3/22]
MTTNEKSDHALIQDVERQDRSRPSSPTHAPQQSVPYSVLLTWETWTVAGMAALGSLFSPLSANVYFPAIPTISKAFHESIENINLTVTVYMILQGISPSVWGSIADRKGRRPSFIFCLLILLLSCIGLALMPTSAYWLLVVLRCVQAAGSASTVALSAGVIADIIPVERRGGYTGIINVGPLVGPAVGPVIGGVLSEKLGWRSIFWFLAIASGSSMFLFILFFPETLRSQVGNGSIPAPKWNRAIIPIIGRSSLDMESERPPPRPLPNPFKLFKEPDLMLIMFATSVVYSTFYGITVSISSIFADDYSFLNETEIGLCFLSIGGGCIFGTVTAGRLLDWQFRRVKRKFEASQKHDSEKNRDSAETRDVASSLSAYDNFPLEKACLQTQHVWIVLFSICTIGYGWSLQSKTSIAVPLILQFFLGFCMTASMTNIQTIIIDFFPLQGSSVTAAFNLVRCLMGAATVSVINIIINAIGAGWTYTLCGGLCFLTWPLLLVELKMGPTWRRRREERNRKARETSS